MGFTLQQRHLAAEHLFHQDPRTVLRLFFKNKIIFQIISYAFQILFV